MKYKELFTEGNGLFATYFYPDFGDEYQTIFASTPPEELDAVAAFKYGNRTLSEGLTAATAAPVLRGIISMRVSDWLKQAEAMTTEYNAVTPTTAKVTKTENRDTSEQGTDNTTNAEKAFNDDMFTDGERDTSEQNKTRTETVTSTTEQQGTTGNVSENVVKEMELRRNKWQEKIIFALVSEITLDIYE